MTLTAASQLAAYRSNHVIELQQFGGEWRCAVDGLRVLPLRVPMGEPRRWRHDPSVVVRLIGLAQHGPTFDRRIRNKDGWWIDPEAGTITGRAGRLIGSITGEGYVHIRHKDGSSETAHRVIWEAAMGPIPSDRQINHKNGIKSDNRIANLEVVTPQENIRHAYDTGLASNAGPRSPRHVLTEDQVRAIRAMPSSGGSERETARSIMAVMELPVGETTVRDIRAGRTWQMPLPEYVSERQDDPLGQAKARRDAFEDGRLTFEWHGHAVDVDLE